MAQCSQRYPLAHANCPDHYVQHPSRMSPLRSTRHADARQAEPPQTGGRTPRARRPQRGMYVRAGRARPEAVRPPPRASKEYTGEYRARTQLVPSRRRRISGRGRGSSAIVSSSDSRSATLITEVKSVSCSAIDAQHNPGSLAGPPQGGSSDTSSTDSPPTHRPSTRPRTPAPPAARHLR